MSVIRNAPDPVSLSNAMGGAIAGEALIFPALRCQMNEPRRNIMSIRKNARRKITNRNAGAMTQDWESGSDSPRRKKKKSLSSKRAGKSVRLVQLKKSPKSNAMSAA